MNITAVTTPQLISTTTVVQTSQTGSAEGEGEGTIGGATAEAGAVAGIDEVGDDHDVDDVGEIEGEDDGEAAEKIAGVLLHLEEGHFSAVAALRLRINFAERLEELRNERIEEATEGGAEALVDAVGSALNELARADDLVEGQAELVSELEEIFAAAVEEAADQFLAAGDVDTAALQDSLEGAFETLSGSLAEAVAAPIESADDGSATDVVSEAGAVTAETAEPSATGTEAEPASALTSAFQAFLADLAQTFSAELESLVSSVEGAAAEPELPGPKGHGRAHEKFLAIYNEIRSGDASRPSEVSEPVGLVV